MEGMEGMGVAGVDKDSGQMLAMVVAGAILCKWEGILGGLEGQVEGMSRQLTCLSWTPPDLSIY